MDAEARLTLLGFSHRTAPVDVRERWAVRSDDLAAICRSLRTGPEIAEAFVLSTCNRTEALVLSGSAVDPAPHVTQTLFRNLDKKHLYRFDSLDALIHVFRVSAGLDSMILGESEVLAQLRRGFDAGKEVGAIQGELGPLLTHALVVGKRVRSETGLGQGTLSVARVGVDMAARVFHRFEHCRALVIGAGDTGVLVARHLRAANIGTLRFCNRTKDRAADVASELGASVHGLEDLRDLLTKSDVVVCAVEANSPTLLPAHLDVRAVARRDRPLLLVDLSVPRGIDPTVAEFENVLLYDLDDLGRAVETNLASREQAISEADRLVVSEIHKFLSLRTFKTFTPVIAQMRERFESVRDETLDQVAGAHATPDQVRLAHELSKKLLDVALAQMKESARRTRSTRTLEGEYQRFLENL